MSGDGNEHDDDLTRSLRGDAPTGPPRLLVTLPPRVGPYVVGEVLGRGAMGVVAAATDERDGSRVALKFLAPGPSRDEAELLRVEREARLLAAIRHPNAALIHGIEEHDGAPVLVLELVEGPTLSQVLARGALPVAESVRITREVAAAVEAAHARGIVHRDLKPGNVKVAPDGRVKVLDFGIACRAAGDAPRALASEAWDADRGTIAGTPGYMSPEQVAGAPAGPSDDAWALGCILYECLTGRRAFDGGTTAARIAATMRRTPDLGALPQDAPAEVVALLRSCLAAEPAERPPDAGAVRRALDTARGETAPEPPAPAAPTRRLPHPRSAFIGRERELALLREALATHRLLTLTGGGGSGKTRLALQLALGIEAHPPAGCFAGGAAFVELGELSEATHVVQHVAQSLGLAGPERHVTREALVQDLATAELLVILDNCEHLASETAALASAVLAGCPGVSIVATSRAPLKVHEERVVPVAPLPTPSEAGAEDIARNASVALFVERARSARFGFRLDDATTPLVARCCRRLEGVPLAIELAASRLRAMPLEQLARELDATFAVLDGGSADAMRRHQALSLTMDWSHDLLDEQERALYRRLSVFVAPFTLALAEEVAGGDGLPRAEVVAALMRLEEESLVTRADGDDVPRWRFLAPVHEHASARLAASSERAPIRARMVDAFIAISKEAVPRLGGAQFSSCVAELAPQHANIVEAIKIAGASGRGTEAVQLMSDLGMYFVARTLWAEGRELLRQLMATDLTTHARADALLMSGQFAMMPGDSDAAWECLSQALPLFRESGDEGYVAETLITLSQVAWQRQDLAEARRLAEESARMRRELGLHALAANSLNQLGLVAHSAGDLPAARAHFEEALELQRGIGNEHMLSVSLSNLAVVAIDQDDLDAARAWLLEAAELAHRSGSRRGELFAFANLASLELSAKRPAEVREWLRRAAACCRSLGDRPGAMFTVLNYARLLEQRGDLAAAARMQGASLALRDSIGAPKFRKQELWDAVNVKLARALGQEAFDAAFAAGRAFTLDEMLAEIEGD